MTTRFEWGGGADYEGHPFLLQALTHQLRHIPSPHFLLPAWSLLPTHPHPPPPGNCTVLRVLEVENRKPTPPVPPTRRGRGYGAGGGWGILDSLGRKHSSRGRSRPTFRQSSRTPQPSPERGRTPPTLPQSPALAAS